MGDTVYEEATRCPKCQTPGEKVSTTPIPKHPGAKAHILFCRNEACKWFNTSWIVQVNPDGTIPIRTAGEKEFPKLPSAGDPDFEQRVQAALNRQIELETRPGGAEVTNPRI